MKRRRPSVSLLVSVALHVVLGGVLIRVVLMPLPLAGLFARGEKSPPVERISFLALPRTHGPTQVGRSGGDGHPEAKRPPAPVIAPRETPTAVPPPSPAAQPPAGGSGAVVGAGGPTRGIRPAYSDPRVWAPASDVVSAPRTAAERLDSSLTARLQARIDSQVTAAAHQGRSPTDWTFKKNGKTYGIDPQFIHLGDVSLPTAVLALLPFNRQGNMLAIQNENRLNQMHADIVEQAQRAYTEEEFRNAVREIRERKERERSAKDGTIAGGGSSTPVPPPQPPAPNTPRR